MFRIAFTVFALLASAMAAAADFSIGKLRISHPYTYETAAPGITAGGYLSITNTGKTDDRLLGAASSAASGVELHEMSMSKGVMKMRALPEGLPLPAKKTVVLAPGSLHFMLFGPTQAFAKGQRVPLTLRFAKAGKLEVELVVEAREPEGESPLH